MRTEIDEALLVYEHLTGIKPDINTNWTSMQHINWRRIVIEYRRFKNHGLSCFDNVGNKKMIKKHKL